MKKATLIIWAIILGVLALVIFQNQEFFLGRQSLRINFGITEEYLTPELPIAVLALIFFFCGVIIAYLFSVSARFRSRRTIKKLNATLTSQKNELTELKNEINSLKGIEPEAEEEAAEPGFTMDATQKISHENIGGGPEEKTDEFSIDHTASNPAEQVEDKSSKEKR
jgi:uncharacterized integral membrane protein